jgi:Flp pilus assembly pilin Flp
MPGRDCSPLISSIIPGNLIGTSRSERDEREASPSSEHDPLKQGLTFPKRESTILLDPRRLESLFCLSFSRRGLRDLSWFLCPKRRYQMKKFVRSQWNNQDGQDIAEYAVMLAVILVVVVGTIRLVGSNANNVFSSVASSVN